MSAAPAASTSPAASLQKEPISCLVATYNSQQLNDRLTRHRLCNPTVTVFNSDIGADLGSDLTQY
jgi:hypothetical protein